MATAQRFSQTFREEHRAVRDALLDLVQAFSDRDPERARSLLERTAELTGPHFRYEEEALYPELATFFGEDYIEQLLADHDRAIGTAKRLLWLSQSEALSDEETEQAIRDVRSMLPHVSDCDGLSIMVERLPEATIDAVFEARDRARDENLDLIEWADRVRRR